MILGPVIRRDSVVRRCRFDKLKSPSFPRGSAALERWAQAVDRPGTVNAATRCAGLPPIRDRAVTPKTLSRSAETDPFPRNADLFPACLVGLLYLTPWPGGVMDDDLQGLGKKGAARFHPMPG